MRPRLVAAVCVLVVMLPTAVRVREGLERRWWHVAEMQRQLGLTAGQIETLDALFERERPERVERHRTIEEMDRNLARILQRGSADDESVARLSEEVEALRVQQNVRRTLMLFAMYKTLTPQQRALLTHMHRSGRESARRRPVVH
jgi:Spy/CpxP family protein refolding chaperone